LKLIFLIFKTEDDNAYFIGLLQGLNEVRGYSLLPATEKSRLIWMLDAGTRSGMMNGGQRKATERLGNLAHRMLE